MNIIIRLRQAMPFSDVGILGEYLSLGDFLLAALLAVVIVWVARRVRSVVKFAVMSPEEAHFMQLNIIMQRCYAMFPLEIFDFEGQTFVRGMLIRVTTRAQQTFEGRFLGMNNHNVICVITENHLAADTLDNILEIMPLGDGEEQRI